MKKYTSHSLTETAQIAHDWLESISKTADSTHTTIVGLSGHLGAGKTAFVKLIAKELGVQEEITSPTFVIMKIYPIEHPRWKRLVHIDAYRLENREELKAINFDVLVSDAENLIMFEWPENVELMQQYPQTKIISFEILDDIHQVTY